MKKSLYKEYCSGCGLCHAVAGVEFERDRKGYPSPSLDSVDEQLLKKICPAGGAASAEFGREEHEIWGKYRKIYLGWAQDQEIRTTASSGGIISALCCYLLENRLVDGVVQTKVDDGCAYKTKTVVSKTPKEVVQCCGSRYSISSPLEHIFDLMEKGKTYAFVGKPCDVSALKMYLDSKPEVKKQVKYLFSFFCAGVPSDDAQKRLLSTLECDQAEDCIGLTYRGNGWPGYTTAEMKDGRTCQITYQESWGNILGRDVRKACRFCLDGVGECADIACGDAWYLNKDNTPDFSEHDGRNVIFARNALGEELIQKAIKDGWIAAEDYSADVKDLKLIQKYQYQRKTTMRAMLLAMRVWGKSVPEYDKAVLKSYSRMTQIRTRVRRFLGTTKRIWQHKI